MTIPLAQAGGLFTVPAIAAVGAAAVSVPIVIHLMSRFRRRPEAWGAMRFLLEAYKKQRKRLQVERLLLLLVRCVLVLTAGLALAGPVLSGCTRGAGLGGLMSGNSSGRVVYLVIDDALSTQTREAGGTRLDRLKDEALSVIDEMQDGDRAVVMRMGRPPVWVIEEPTGDRAALRDAVVSIRPRYSRSGLRAALIQVESSMDAWGVGDGNAVVVLLSDFSRSSADLDEQLPPELEGLGRRASIVTALPAQGTDNVQVASVTPRRRMVVAGAAGGSVSAEVRLRRFGGEPQPRQVRLRVRLLDASGTEVASATRTVRWLAGQREALVNLDLPASSSSADESAGGRELVLVAELEADNASAGLDALRADDRAMAVVELRERLQVALIDDGSVVNDQPGALQPWQWMRAALSPGSVGATAAGAFEVSMLLPSAVSESGLTAVDAAVVLRPDLLGARGWGALSAFAERGGLVWVFAPAVDGDALRWSSAMVRAFDLPWEVRAAAVSETGDALDSTTRPPVVLQYLAADWREKLGRVSVARRLPMRAPEEDRWIVMDTTRSGLPDPDAPVLMAGRSVEGGTLLFTATSPDARDTNLVVRPLFAPLVHDTIRGVLGDAGRAAPVVAGDAPDLGRRWLNAGQLAWAGGIIEAEATAPQPVSIRTDGAVAQVIEAIDRPGLYQASGASGGLLAVNPDASAGDTHPAQPRLEQWLDKLGGAGGWSYLDDQRRAGGVLATSTGAEDLTGPLLWVLLALVLVEMVLARRFSHATDHDRPTVVGRALTALAGHSSDEAKAATRGGGA